MKPIEDARIQMEISGLREKLFDVLDTERQRLMDAGMGNAEWSQIVVSALANVSSLMVICLFSWPSHLTAIEEFGRVLEKAYDQNIAHLAEQEAADRGAAH